MFLYFACGLLYIMLQGAVTLYFTFLYNASSFCLKLCLRAEQRRIRIQQVDLGPGFFKAIINYTYADSKDPSY